MNYLNLIKFSFDLWDYRKTDSVAKDVLSKEFTIPQGLVLYVIFLMISTALSTIPLLVSGELLDIFFMPGYIFGVLLILILAIPLFFLVMLLNHLFIRLFKGDKTYYETVKVFLILMIPYLIFQAVYSFITMFIEILAILGGELFYFLYLLVTPISLVVMIYYLVILVKTFAITHNMGVQNAVLAGVTSIVSITVILIILFVIFFFIGLAAGLGAYGLTSLY